MKRLLLATLLSIAGITANAAVLTFDDIAGASGNTYGSMPVYQGFTFNGTSNWIDTVNSSWNYGAHSGEYTLLNNYGGYSVIKAEDNADFTFDGLWAKTWDNSSARNGTIRGYNNGVQVWASNGTLDQNFSFFGGVAGMVDELQIDLGNHFLIDDVALNNNHASQVPEPASLALLGLGLAGIAAARRRRNKQA